MQELKTAQDQLPGKVVEALTAAEWLHYASTLHDEPFAVPGITLTSFHIQQLQRLGEVSCFADPAVGPVVQRPSRRGADAHASYLTLIDRAAVCNAAIARGEAGLVGA